MILAEESKLSPLKLTIEEKIGKMKSFFGSLSKNDDNITADQLKEERVMGKHIQSYKCRCGGNSAHTLDSFYEEVAGKSILIHNFPHYICSECKEFQYDAGNSLMRILKYALEEKLSEVDYRECDGKYD